MKLISRIILFFLISYFAICQNKFSLGFWKFNNNSFTLGAEYNVKNQITIYNNIFENQWYNSLIGDIRLSSDSYIWNEKLLKININGAWNPNTKIERNIIMPNTNQVLTSERLHLGLIMLDKLPVTVGYNYDLTHSYQTNDLTTNLESNSNINSINLALKTKFISMNLGYSRDKSLIKELSNNGRSFETSTELFSYYTDKSFSEYDNNNLILSYNIIQSKYSDGLDYINNLLFGSLISNLFLSSDNNMMLNNNLTFNRNDFKNRNININQNSNLSQRLNNSTNLNIKLPYNFKFHTNYQKSLNSLDSNKLDVDNVMSRLEHQLFASLKSYAEFSYIKSEHTQFNEKVLNFGGGINYSKNIGFGRLNLDYLYKFSNENKIGKVIEKNIKDEQFQFDDSKIVLLENYNIDDKTIEVKNSTGTRIYQLGIDYIIRKFGYFVELKRIPGGQIIDKEITFVSYTSKENSSYKYDVNLNMLGARLNIFDDLFECYVNFQKNEYSNLTVEFNKFLQTVDSKVFGVSSKYSDIYANIEFEINQSNQMPYSAIRLNSSYSYFSTNSYSIFLLANMSRTNYKETNDIYNLGNINIQFNYYPSYTSKYEANLGYNIQNSSTYNLNYLVFNLEWERFFNSFYFIIKYENYYRFNKNDNLLHNGLKFKIERRI